MLSIDILREYGANVDEGLARCLDNAEFYIKMVDMGIHDKKFDSLRGHLEAGNLEDGFEVCHALKGVIGNLALDPIFAPLSELTELLRARTETDYMPLFEKLMGERQKLLSLIDE